MGKQLEIEEQGTSLTRCYKYKHLLHVCHCNCLNVCVSVCVDQCAYDMFYSTLNKYFTLIPCH